ncbi:hypothetical protein B0H13DRAFT_1872524 [Mycena leptocephala]|nr:hypothetical protein B0H13DRAFT_1872524 [Mycena leptocephala]
MGAACMHQRARAKEGTQGMNTRKKTNPPRLRLYKRTRKQGNKEQGFLVYVEPDKESKRDSVQVQQVPSADAEGKNEWTHICWIHSQISKRNDCKRALVQEGTRGDWQPERKIKRRMQARVQYVEAVCMRAGAEVTGMAEGRCEEYEGEAARSREKKYRCVWQSASGRSRVMRTLDSAGGAEAKARIHAPGRT